jgi:hypothetical protein
LPALHACCATVLFTHAIVVKTKIDFVLTSPPRYLQIKALLIANGKAESSIVDWEGYKAIDAAEVALGAARGKPREKLVTVDDMLQAARSVTKQ